MRANACVRGRDHRRQLGQGGVCRSRPAYRTRLYPGGQSARAMKHTRLTHTHDATRHTHCTVTHTYTHRLTHRTRVSRRVKACRMTRPDVSPQTTRHTSHVSRPGRGEKE